MRKFLTLFLLIGLIACKKEPLEREFKSVQSNLYVTSSHALMPPHEYIMRILIPEMERRNYQYDSVYVTCLPYRCEDEVEFKYTVKGSFVLIYRFFSPKKTMNDTMCWVMYDPQGDSIQKYMGTLYY